jgi:hypothetical protein
LSRRTAAGGNRADTSARWIVAGRAACRHTLIVGMSMKRGLLTIAILAGAMSVAALSARADEIRLKDGKKLYGVIVAYEDNMFKVKTDFGYVLVEKDKIASIIPTTPASPKTEPTAKKEAGAEPSQPAKDSQPRPEPAVASSAEPTATKANSKSVVPGAAEKLEKAAPRAAPKRWSARWLPALLSPAPLHSLPR